MGGGKKVVAMLKGGQNKFWGSFSVEAILSAETSFSHTEGGGGGKGFQPLKNRGEGNIFTLS